MGARLANGMNRCEAQNRIIKMVKDGAFREDIIRKLNVTSWFVWVTLKEAGLKCKRQNRRLTKCSHRKYDCDTIKTMRESGATLKEIAQVVNISAPTVRKICIEMGIPNNLGKIGQQLRNGMEKSEAKRRVVDMANDGKCLREIIAELDVSENFIYKVLKEEGIKAKRSPTIRTKEAKKADRSHYRKYDYDWIRCQRERGMSYKQIAKVLGVNQGCVSAICKKIGMDGVMSENNKRRTLSEVEDVIARAGFQYVSGFVNTKSKVIVRCPVCNGTFEAMYHNIRETNMRCKVCAANEIRDAQNARMLAKHQERQAKRQAKEKMMADKRKAKEEATARKLNDVHVCKNCGCEFTRGATGYNSDIYCSVTCMKRYVNRYKINKRLMQIKSRPHDDDITLEKVYAVSNGICYLCGSKCRWDDKCVDSTGTIIAGGKYPSIEHIIPISKGGRHEWANVALACRECNTMKGNKSVTNYNASKTVQQIAMVF